jgi:hypothetical protein
MRTDTDLIPFPWLQPEVRTTRYVGLGARIRRSPFLRDMRAAWRSTFWVRVIGAGLLLGLYVMATRHTYLDWTGFHAINGGLK